MATPLKCGTGGSTGAEIVQRINDLATIDPRATAKLSAPVTVTLDDTTPVKLEIFDTTKTERTGFEVNLSQHRLVNNSGKSYYSAILTIGLNVRFPAQEKLDLWLYVNGVASSTSEFTIRGEGDNKPVAVFWQTDIQFNDGDYLELYGINAATGSVDVVFEHVHFRVEADYKDTIA